MKFEKIYINGFGVFQDQELDGISAGLNIIEGANEAGKTTMLEFVRALFFGFAQRDKSNDDARRYEPRGGEHGGWAIVRNSHDEQLRIERTGDKTSAGYSNVQVLGTDRNMEMEVLLNDADRALFEQVFAFSLDELTGFSQSDETVRNRIYAASSGRSSDALFGALKQTSEEAKAIYTRRGRNQSLNKALSEYRNLQSRITNLSGQVADYNREREELLRYQQETEILRQRFQAIKNRLDSAKLYAAVWETWVELAALRRELSELPDQPEFDSVKAAAMPELKARLQQQQDAIEEKLPRLKRLEEEVAECAVNEDILQKSVSIKTLKEQLGSYESTKRALPLEQQKREGQESELKVLLEQLGPRWDEESVERIDTSREPRLQIQQWESELAKRETALNEAIQKESATAQLVRQQEQSLQRLHEEMDREFPVAPPEPDQLNQQANALREANSLLRNIETAHLKAEFLRKEIAEKQARIDHQPQSQPDGFPAWTALLPLPFAALAGFLLWQQPALAILVAAGCIIVAAGLFVLARRQNHRHKQRIDEEQQQSQQALIVLQQQLHDSENAISDAGAQLQSIGKKWNWRLESEADYQTHLQELSRHREQQLRYANLQDNAKRRSSDLDVILETQKSQKEQIDSQKSTFIEAQNQWKEWLAARHLPESASPRQTLDLFDDIIKARNLMRDRNQQKLSIATKEEQCREFEDTANTLWQTLQRDVPQPDRLADAVRRLNEELEDHHNKAIRRESLVKTHQQLQDEIDVQNKNLQETAAQIEQLLTETGCADQDAFDIKTHISQQRDELETRCRAQERILETHSAPGAAREKLEKELTTLDAPMVQHELETAQAEFDHVENDMSQALRTQGEWDNKIQQREKEEGELTALLRQLEIQKSLIADLTQQWAVAQLTHLLLDSTREQFERERQPAVIKRAGELMKIVTAGRYQAVLASSLDKVELDEGEKGRKPLSRWSRGTREQFYLALRLAFIEDYCSQAHLEPLPVLMDDVLVHSDGYNRLAAASDMIAQFAEKYQVLYFTCRPGDAEVLAQSAPTARRFQLERGKFVQKT